MTTHNLVRGSYWYNGTIVGKDNDGVLVVDWNDPVEPLIARSLRRLYPITRTAEFTDGVTTGKDNDGRLVMTSEVLELNQTDVLIWRTSIVTPPLTRVLFHTPSYYDGVTVDKDHDGALVMEDLDPLENAFRFSIKRQFPLAYTPQYVKAYGEPLSKDSDGVLVLNEEDEIGRAPLVFALWGLPEPITCASYVTAGTPSLVARTSGDTQGESSVAGSAVAIRLVSGAAQGSSLVEGIPTLVAVAGAYGDIVFTGEIASFLAITTPLPSVSRSFAERLDELRPLEGFEIGFAGDNSVNNRVRVLSTANLAVVASYSGPAYTPGGPPDPLASPVRLGFKRGDKIKLSNPGAPNDGKEYTFSDPNSWGVLESIVTPDSYEYEFVILRRIS